MLTFVIRRILALVPLLLVISVVVFGLVYLIPGRRRPDRVRVERGAARGWPPQSQVVNLMQDLQERLGVSYLFIAHDLSVVRHAGHRIAVMYLGGIVEVGHSRELGSAPRHPYTQALLSAVPVPNPRIQRRRSRIVLEGDIPSPANPPAGCRFHTRCPSAMPVCAEIAPERTSVEDGAWVACHLHTSGPTLAGAPLPEARP